MWQCVGSDFKIGARSVELFFIISGYLAFKTLDKGYTVKEYYKGRVIRIIPVYYLCLLITYTVYLIIGVYRSSLKDILLGQCGPRFLRYFFFLQGIVPSDNWNMWNNHGALWSMSSFAIFYLAAPLLFKIMKRYYSAVLILVIAIIMRPYLITLISSLFINYPAEAHIEWLSEMNPLVEIYAFSYTIHVTLVARIDKYVRRKCT